MLLYFAGTRREIVVYSGDHEVGRMSYDEDLVDPATQATEKFELDCFLLTPDNEVSKVHCVQADTMACRIYGPV